ncbi:hypothetical protein [Snodgrassella gandavensis]|uniref:hypothetical protein n=1 Tax=Snodgrassella gandavensis TaxID=2946698 RepID=UPI001EF7097A|nr:hypothetical protein [Snodgrassella gandavensis]
MKLSFIRYLILFSFFIFHSGSVYAVNIKGLWTNKIYLDNSEIPYSTFSIQLTINTDDTVAGELCSIAHFGNKIDCHIRFKSRLANNQIKVHFDSTFGGKDGIAIITLQRHNLKWDLITAPNGEYYFDKKAILHPVKIKN